jgi:hypothetical protein
LALAPHSTKLVLPASASTLRSFTSLDATCAAVSGFHWSSATMYSIGRPLMPPFWFTHLK